MDRLRSLLSLESAIRAGEADEFDIMRFKSELLYRRDHLSLDKVVYDKYMRRLKQWTKKD